MATTSSSNQVSQFLKQEHSHGITILSPNHSEHRRFSLVYIDSVVAARLGPTRGLGKSQPVCFNRQVAMYLASHFGHWSTTVIGRFYGARDHSTVVHAIQRIKAMRETDPNLDVLLCDLKSRIGDASQSMKESRSLGWSFASMRKKKSTVRILTREIAAQVVVAFQEEFCPASAQRSSDGRGEADRKPKV